MGGVAGTSRSQENTILGAWENRGKLCFLGILECTEMAMSPAQPGQADVSIRKIGKRWSDLSEAR